jgi:hypothetical protein
MRCKWCRYPIQFNGTEWEINYSDFSMEEEDQYDHDTNAFKISCIDGVLFQPHQPEVKSNNFKLIYDILNNE